MNLQKKFGFSFEKISCHISPKKINRTQTLTSLFRSPLNTLRHYIITHILNAELLHCCVDLGERSANRFIGGGKAGDLSALQGAYLYRPA